ncbi:hypothetical protein, partial [Neglectibacter sp. X4]|uniref:hypothetical protein n=1 Tax=Neglectibacter sp. X4 TaxID=2305472 RepID=UPI001A9B3A5F
MLSDILMAPFLKRHPEKIRRFYLDRYVCGIHFVEHRLLGKGKANRQKIQYSCGFAARWLSKANLTKDRLLH